MYPANESTFITQSRAPQLLRRILISATRDNDIESNIVSVIGTNFKSAYATMIHLVPMKSSEVAVIGFLQKISTSFVKVMMYSQTASTDPVVSTHARARVA